MRYYVITGDRLNEFSVTVESEERITEDQLDQDALHKKVAATLGYEDGTYARLELHDLAEVDEHGCELDVPDEEP